MSYPLANMNYEQAYDGMPVSFGRENGQRTIAKIFKRNRVKAKVRILEQRGYGRGSEVGSIWVVPYEMLTPATEADVARVTSQKTETPREKVTLTAADVATVDAMKLLGVGRVQPANSVFHPILQSNIDKAIMAAIVACYAALEPETLHCDGEANPAVVRRHAAEYNRKLNAMFNAIGGTVTAEEAYAWEDAYLRAKAKRH